MFKWFIILGLSLGSFIFWFNMEQKEIIFNNIKLTVEVAKSPAQQSKGLSARKDLCDNCGMLFSYDDLATRYFWMNQMNFPLDIIWFNGNKVVGLSQDVSILDNNGKTTRISSPGPVSAVLELKAGWISKNNPKIGDVFIGLD